MPDLSIFICSTLHNQQLNRASESRPILCWPDRESREKRATNTHRHTIDVSQEESSKEWKNERMEEEDERRRKKRKWITLDGCCCCSWDAAGWQSDGSSRALLAPEQRPSLFLSLSVRLMIKRRRIRKISKKKRKKNEKKWKKEKKNKIQPEPTSFFLLLVYSSTDRATDGR